MNHPNVSTTTPGPAQADSVTQQDVQASLIPAFIQNERQLFVLIINTGCREISRVTDV